MAILYILLGISIFVPIYTYGLYPLILRLFPKRSFNEDVLFNPRVSVLVLNKGCLSFEQKKQNILSTNNGVNIIEIIEVINSDKISSKLYNLKGDVVVVTNSFSLFTENAIRFLLNSLSTNSVGLVSGMSRKQPDLNGNFTDGANWAYENQVKVLESNIGSLSGANPAIFAFKKCLLPESITESINLDFFLSTAISEMGLDVIFQPKALAYEVDNKTEKILFKKHVNDGICARKSLLFFWHLLLPRKGSFVFWSHRVMKWLVPFNMLYVLIVSFLMAASNTFFLYLLLVQLLLYFYVLVFYLIFVRNSRIHKGVVARLSEFACYFITLNLAWFIGFIKQK